MRIWAGAIDQFDVAERSARLSLHPIVRAHLDDRLEPSVRQARYGCLLTDYALADLADAEVAVLPLAFERTDRVDLHHRLNLAERRGLTTIAFSVDDLEPVMPSESMVVLHPGPTRGAQPRGRAIAVPYFFADRATGPEPRPSSSRPTVAFCGQGASRRGTAAMHTAERALAIMRNRRGPKVVAPPLRGHVSIRSRALRSLHRDPRIDDRFVIRNRYRAGAVTDSERARTQAEFDDNLRSAAYALCVRGQGNFSARFYEALSFGRVPVFIDTRCVLPFEDEIDWRQHCVWVDGHDVDQVAETLVEAHDTSMADERHRAASLRQLWEERLTQDGFFRHFADTARDWSSA